MSAAADPAFSPREWIGDDDFPWPPVLGLLDGERVAACFSVTHVSLGRTRDDTPFLRLQLTDAHGTVEGRMWEDVDAVADHIRVGGYVGVRGFIETYHEQRQLHIEQLAPLRVELDDLVFFLPRSARSPERMEAELAAAIASIGDDPLRHLVTRLLDAGSDVGRAFRLAPAAKQNHHAWLGGLLEHTLSVVRVCDLLAAHYGSGLDRDLLIAGALLHDIGKIREIGARSGFPYTDEGKLLGHIIIGMQIVADAAAGVPSLNAPRLLLLQHLIASHQGRFEWQSPREPRTLEAILLHYVDDLDAKLNQAARLLDAVNGGWTAYDRAFGRDFLRHLQERAAAEPSSPRGAPPAEGVGDTAAGHDQGDPPVRRGATDPPVRQGAAEPTADAAPGEPPLRTEKPQARRRSAAGQGASEAPAPGGAVTHPPADEDRRPPPDPLETLDLFET